VTIQHNLDRHQRLADRHRPVDAAQAMTVGDDPVTARDDPSRRGSSSHKAYPQKDLRQDFWPCDAGDAKSADCSGSGCRVTSAVEGPADLPLVTAQANLPWVAQAASVNRAGCPATAAAPAT